MSGAVERIGQKTTALKESVGETWQKVRSEFAEHRKQALENYQGNARNPKWRDQLGVIDLEGIPPVNSSLSSRPQWLQEILDRGNNFNKKHAFDYPHRELYLEAPKNKLVRLDGYDDVAREIISRKFTQLSEIQETSAFNYLRELKTKYPSGAKVAKVKSSGPLAGKPIRGRQILEVPIQNNPVPKGILDKAGELGITIRDVGGTEY